MASSWIDTTANTSQNLNSLLQPLLSHVHIYSPAENDQTSNGDLLSSNNNSKDKGPQKPKNPKRKTNTNPKTTPNPKRKAQSRDKDLLTLENFV